MEKKLDEYYVQEKTGVDKALDFLVFIAVFVVTIFLVLEILSQAGSKVVTTSLESMNAVYAWVNWAVFIIFSADLVRLWVDADGLADFCKENWLDILATIPFGIMFSTMTSFNILKLAKVAKLTSVTKVSRVSKITKEFKAASHMKNEGEEYKRKHRL